MTISLTLVIPSLVYGATIDCTFYVQVKHYTCYVTKETLDNPNFLHDIVGRHAYLKNNYDVRGFILRQSKSEVFYKGIGEFFPNLVSFRWQYSNLKSITARDLESFPNLTQLDLSHNLLLTLDSDLFKYIPRIVGISIMSNKIQHIGENIFDGLKELKTVLLYSNPCIDGYYWGKGIQYEKAQLREACPPLTTPSAPRS